MINALKRKVPSVRTVRDLIHNYNHMICDDSFQRDYVWELRDERDYISTLLNGGACSAIILADLQSCLTASEQRGTKYGGRRLRNQIYEGRYTESKIDGHQRTTTLERFHKDEFTISGNFYDKDAALHSVTNKHFSQLDLRLQDTFLDSTVVVTSIYGYTFEELVQLFIDIQKGADLVAAEIRWAMLTPYNPWVKDRRAGFSTALAKVQKIAKKIKRKLDVETFDQTVLALMPATKTKDSGQSNINAWYEYGAGRSSCQYVPEYDSGELERAHKIFVQVINPILVNNTTDYARVALRTYWAVVTAAEYIWDNNYGITDYPAMYTLIKEVNSDLFSSSKTQHASDLQNARKQGSDDPPDSGYFWWWCGVPHIAAHRSKKNSEFIVEFAKRLKSANLVTTKQLAA